MVKTGIVIEKRRLHMQERANDVIRNICVLLNIDFPNAHASCPSDSEGVARISVWNTNGRLKRGACLLTFESQSAARLLATMDDSGTPEVRTRIVGIRCHAGCVSRVNRFVTGQQVRQLLMMLLSGETQARKSLSVLNYCGRREARN